MRSWTSLFILSAFLVACDDGGDASGGDGGTGIDSSPTSSDPGPTGSSSGPDDSTSSTSDSTTGNPTAPPGDDDDSGDDPEPPVTFDFGTIPDVGDSVLSGCNAVDFLFVIDNSGSMLEAQANLVANFPAFIDGIQSTLTDVESYHVGIATTDDHTGGGIFPPSNPPECRQLGALVTSTAGSGSSNSVCGPYTEGFNFITEEDDLTASFECAARVGTQGAGLELTMNAMEAAIGDELNAEGACNEGFIRDDALLVVVIITDESDGPGDFEGAPPNSSTGDPLSWHQSVVTAKNDIPENAAALVLTNWEGGPCPPDFGWEDGTNLVNFAGLFGENGFLAGICEPDYGPAFANATAVIEQACENFIPPG